MLFGCRREGSKKQPSVLKYDNQMSVSRLHSSAACYIDGSLLQQQGARSPRRFDLKRANTPPSIAPTHEERQHLGVDSQLFASMDLAKTVQNGGSQNTAWPRSMWRGGPCRVMIRNSRSL